MVTAAPVMEDTVSALERTLQERIGLERFDLWFDRKTQLDVRPEEKTLCVEAANAFAADWIRAKFSEDLREAARSAFDGDFAVTIRVNPKLQGAPAEKPAAGRGAMPGVRPTAGAGARYESHSAPLNPRYTFEEFVVGPSNQMCYHAACQVAANPGQQFNPLFLYGHCGLGKTHLLQSICQRFAQRFDRSPPGKKLLYLTGEQFTNEFLEAIKTHKTDAFRKRIRSADLLVIDDVHFLANKKATQEEFLHTFNQIDASGKQVVLASDCAPREIAAMADPLVNRFVSGMVLRVDSPDLPTRLEILRRKAARMNRTISDAVLMHVAQAPASSVRELEGLLMQVVAGLTLTPGGTGTAEEAGNAVLANIKDRTAMRLPISAERIVQAVAEYFHTSPAAILGNGREKTVSMARSVAMYLCRQHTRMSFPEIARSLGNKNHSTVIAACQRVMGMIAGNRVLLWCGPEGVRTQAIQEVLHTVESLVRRVR